MEQDIFVDCKEISIGYKERSNALSVVKSDISLRALKGEMVALIGGNGVGKSTLLKTIAGFQSPISGELLIHRRLVSDYNSEELARELSFVSTEIVRVAHLTVREMVGLGRYPYTNWFGQLNSQDEEIVDKAIREAGLSGYETRFINRISDGERQKAMIARALAQDTRIMVLDEPTAFLDISNKYEIVRILHQLVSEYGKCIIFSTHDLHTALSMADRIWLMLNEKVVQGIPEEVAGKGYFESLFPNNHHLIFDTVKGDFTFRKEIKGVVKLSASGTELIIAKKALERLGLEVISDHPDQISSPSLPVSPSPKATGNRQQAIVKSAQINIPPSPKATGNRQQAIVKNAQINIPPSLHVPVSPSPGLPVPPQGNRQEAAGNSEERADGYFPVPPSLDITVVQSPNGWNLSHSGISVEFESMEELCRQVKQLTLQPKS